MYGKEMEKVVDTALDVCSNVTNEKQDKEGNTVVTVPTDLWQEFVKSVADAITYRSVSAFHVGGADGH